jgi:oligoribonuclease NrnB/cAMP/cGMP phosphodiesterase (DHH superfamily)
MEKLVNKKGDNFLWIDHHKTAMEDYENYIKNGGREIEGLREEGKAGCELTWEYMFPDKEMPPAVRMLGRYDVWDHSDPDVVPFQFGMKCVSDTNPKCNCWKWLLEDKNKKTYESVLNDGYKIEHYQKNEWYNYCKSNSFEVDWEGHKFIALNIMNSGSLVFNGFFKKDKHDGMITFGYKNGEYVVSLYTDKKDIDLSKIAKKYGGGGHAGACGFSIKKLPFI